MNKKSIFNGNNESYLEDRRRYNKAYLPDNWTDCALSALDFAYTAARNYNSKMAVVCYLPGADKHFRRFDADIGCDGCSNVLARWYVLTTPIVNKKEIEKKVKIYTQDELAEFVSTHFDEEHKKGLEARKYYKIIYGFEPKGPSLELKLA